MKFVSQILKNFFDFIGYSNLFLAFGVFFSTFQGGLIFDHAVQPGFLFAIVNFFAAFSLYNAQRIYQSFKPTTDERLLWYRRNKKYIFTLGILFILVLARTLFTIFEVYQKSILIYCGIGLISVAYFLPPVELRKKPFIKSFYIAFAWVIVCVVIPFMFEQENFTGLKHFQKDEWLYIISQFCFIAAICMPFDIRDIEKDTADNVRSFPVLIGIQKSKLFAIGLMVLYLILAFFIEVKSLVVVRGLVFLASVLVIWFSETSRHRYYFIYLADGLIILQTLLLFIFL